MFELTKRLEPCWLRTKPPLKGTLNKMKNLRKIASLLLCVCMLLGMTAIAEETAEIAADTVVATVNGVDVTWADLEPSYQNFVSQYGTYYEDAFLRAVALENAITEKLLMEKAVEYNVAELSAEEIAELDAAAESDVENAISQYIAYFHADLTEESSEEDLAAARAEAEAYYAENGITLDSVKADYQHYAIIGKVEGLMVQDATVTDEEVEAYYQSLVEADKALYENDIAAYVDYNNQVDMMAMYAAMYGSASNMDYAWYKPEGFRAVKHILLPIDETLMTTYTDLQARYEEQESAAETAEAAEEATEEAAEETVEEVEPVTLEMINEAKAAILTSVADKIEEINTRIADGADFDELIATYGVDADGNPSDPGMASEPYMTTGYEVCAVSSNYVPEFVEAAMSIAEVGGVSAPYLSDYGIHIVKYIGDVAGGPVAMTDAQRAAKGAELLSSKQNELYMATVEEWMAHSDITYTGAVQTLADLEAQSAAAADDAE